jgi:hypothetical protein
LDLPRNMWQMPLDEYTGRSLADMRGMKAHGAKRIRGVVGVFAAVVQAVGEGAPPAHLEVRIVSRLAARLEDWMQRTMARPQLPSLGELRRGLAEPTVEQARIDIGATVANLVHGRLGMRGAEGSVRQTADALGLTRARVYQLLDEAGEALRIRWPEGGPRLTALLERYASANRRPEWELMQAASELYSAERRSVGLIPRKTARRQAG